MSGFTSPDFTTFRSIIHSQSLDYPDNALRSIILERPLFFPYSSQSYYPLVSMSPFNPRQQSSVNTQNLTEGLDSMSVAAVSQYLPNYDMSLATMGFMPLCAQTNALHQNLLIR